jgi:GTP cyclohydrolase I
MGAQTRSVGEEAIDENPIYVGLNLAFKHIFPYNALSQEALDNTPSRFIRYLMEFNQGGSLGDLMAVFKNGFESLGSSDSQLIVQQDIPMRAVCEHHLLPFFGKVSLGYIPNKKIAGLSKFARLVEKAGLQRPTLQEHLTNSIAEAINQALEPRGVIVVCKGIHTCMAVRGVVAPGTTTITSSVRGVLRDVAAAREEFFNIIGKV